MTTLPWGLFRYPQGLEVPLALGTLFLTAVLVWLLRRRGALTLPRVALSALASVVFLVAAARRVRRVAGGAADRSGPGLGGEREPYVSVLYRLAMLLAGLGVVLGLYAILRPRLRAAELAGHAGRARTRRCSARLDSAGSVWIPRRPAFAGRGRGCGARGAASRGARSPPASRTCSLAVADDARAGRVDRVRHRSGTGGPASAAQLALFVLLALPLIEVAWPYRPGPAAPPPTRQRFRPFC